MQQTELNQTGNSQEALPNWNDIKPRTPRLKWNIGDSKEIVMLGNEPDHHVDFDKKDNNGNSFKERLFVFNCQEAGKDVELGTSSPNLLEQLKTHAPLNGKRLKISKISKGNKSIFTVEELK